MPLYRRPDGTLFEYEDAPRNGYGRHDRYEVYDLPPRFDPYGYDEYDLEYDRYLRRRARHRGCLAWYVVFLVILACVLLVLMSIHPQGFQLIHF
jgi:hypothetical protein